MNQFHNTAPQPCGQRSGPNRKASKTPNGIEGTSPSYAGNVQPTSPAFHPKQPPVPWSWPGPTRHRRSWSLPAKLEPGKERTQRRRQFLKCSLERDQKDPCPLPSRSSQTIESNNGRKQRRRQFLKCSLEKDQKDPCPLAPFRVALLRRSNQTMEGNNEGDSS